MGVVNAGLSRRASCYAGGTDPPGVGNTLRLQYLLYLLYLQDRTHAQLYAAGPYACRARRTHINICSDHPKGHDDSSECRAHAYLLAMLLMLMLLSLGLIASLAAPAGGQGRELVA